ncbi:Mob1/phocein [Lactarius quietus]|nr:Mob1/phocein [Lactarius quietus]
MATALPRPLKGSRISTFYPIKSVPALSTLDSAFQLQEFISLTIRADIHDVSAIISVPDSRTSADGGDRDTRSEFAVDEACWIYEQLRRLAQDLSHPLITMLQQECTRATCPEMKAGEWMYLCVAHGNDGAMEQCCAIDYILHTVDSATALLNSPRAFPSRINIPPPSHRHFGSLARRLGRIFAHAYFHHREVFEQAEAESSLYARFLALTCKFELDAEPPRLLAAAVDPQHSLGPDDEGDDRGRGVHRGLGVDVLGGIDRNPSPRKGRNRTGTMVFSEALIMAEEFGKSGGSPSPERDSLAHLATEDHATEAHEQETDFVHVDVASRAEEEELLTDEHELHADLQEAYDHDLDYPEGDHIATLADTDEHAEIDEDDDHEGPEQDVTDDAEDEAADTETEYADEAPEHDVTSAHEIPGTTIIELSPAEEAYAPEGEDTQEEDLTEAVVEPQDDDAADALEVAEQISPDEAQEEQVDSEVDSDEA